MILDPGSPVLVAHRRLYEGDSLRYFLGTVDGYDQGVARVTGQTWTRDARSGAIERKPQRRTKLVAIASGTVIVYALPADVHCAELRFEVRGDAVVLRDDHGFAMDLSEATPHTTVAPPRKRPAVIPGPALRETVRAGAAPA